MNNFALILVAVIIFTGLAFAPTKITAADTPVVGGDYTHTTSAHKSRCDNGVSHDVPENTASITIHQDGANVALPHGRDVFGTLTSYSSSCWLSDDAVLHCHKKSTHVSKEYGPVKVTTIIFAQHDAKGYKGRSHGIVYSERSGVTCGFELNFTGKRK